ncbi:transglutaminase domain-containing protein [Gammaproteobacteria bacterium AB-CW1]|uniref:Transglutaminase domain-containing protein n=1 Tax=Natronospira elongata TaxID=3110268 RepID=A0AAP6JCR5_9GAMM|nr:transglutaminase domain-containing protein [Gammaproteobacteria bacterium AB-CW1]
MIGRVDLESHFDIRFHASMETPLLLMLRPRACEHQWISQDEFHLSPIVTIREYQDVHGNRCQRIMVPAGHCRIHGMARVAVPLHPAIDQTLSFTPVEQVPDAVIPYLLPSRYCESDRLDELAWRIVGDAPSGYAQVKRIVDWISEQIAYRPGEGHELISATEVYSRGYGVCRDLAHLGVGLCRALSIPARFVSGYLHELEPMDLHAWFEVWLGEHWHAFDPTQEGKGGDRLVLGVGRDGADVPIFHQFGPPLKVESMTFSVSRVP